MDIRIDYVKDERIIYANKRDKRPTNFGGFTRNIIKENFVCPFCRDNTDIVGELVCENGYGSRIVKNKYSILEGDFGVHYVAIESYDHDLQFKDMDIEIITKFLKMMQDRVKTGDKKIKHFQIFKNCGPKSGASLVHAHWQIIGNKFVPNNIRKVSEQLKSFKDETGDCYFCSNRDMLEVLSDDFMVMSIPKAYMTTKSFRIYPKKHITSFLEIDIDTLNSLSKMLIKATKIIDDFEEGSSFNIIFFEKEQNLKDDSFHFFVEVFERKGNFGGFELSSGSYVNSELPEEFYEKVMDKMEV